MTDGIDFNYVPLIAQVFKEIEAKKTEFLSAIYPALAGEVVSLLDTAFLLFIMWIAAMMVWQPGTFRERLQALLKTSFAAALIYICLGQSASDSPVFQYFISPIEEGSLKLSGFIIDQFGASTSLSTFDPDNLYGSLSSVVEAQVMMIVDFGWFLLRLGGLENGFWSGVVGALFAIPTTIALLAPYTYAYVYIIFSLIDVMFTFLLIGSVSPILLAMSLFPVTRSYFVQGCRIISGAAFTVPFLSIALGFTISIIKPEINRASTMKMCTFAENKDLDVCKSLKGIDIYSYITDPHFYILMVLGWVSVLCLMQARVVAADLTQTSNSGIPAAIASAGTMKSLNMIKDAVVQGGKGTAKMTIGAGKKAAELAKHFMS